MASQRELVLGSVGNAIAAARVAAGWSQEELAHRAGLHRTYVGGVERGERNPTVMSLVVICQALELRVADLFTSADL